MWEGVNWFAFNDDETRRHFRENFKGSKVLLGKIWSWFPTLLAVAQKELHVKQTLVCWPSRVLGSQSGAAPSATRGGIGGKDRWSLSLQLRKHYLISAAHLMSMGKVGPFRNDRKRYSNRPFLKPRIPLHKCRRGGVNSTEKAKNLDAPHGRELNLDAMEALLTDGGTRRIFHFPAISAP